jgi:hypothetical protein
MAGAQASFSSSDGLNMEIAKILVAPQATLVADYAQDADFA